jgi:TolA-binding protein
MRFLSNKIPNSTAPNIVPIRNYKHADQESAADKKILDMLNAIEQAIEQLQTQASDMSDTIEQLQAQVSDMSDTIEHLQTQILEKTSYGVVSGLEVTAQDEPDMSVNVSSGIIYMQDGERFEVEADTMAVVEADEENPRIDIIYINETGLVSYMPGVAAEEPTAPETPLGSQLLAEIAVAANATAIEAANITDKSKVLPTT